MARRTRSRKQPPVRRIDAGAPSHAHDDDYWRLSTLPLHVLCFLLPLLVAYEVGSILYLTDTERGTRLTISAHNLLNRFFDAFGLFGILLPGVALVTVLAVWHVAARDPFRVRAAVLPVMALESAAWTLPLLVLSALIQSAHLEPAAALGAATESLIDLPMMERLTIAIGAGLYEEMLFRLVLIALLHLVLADLLGMKHRWAACLAVALSAAAFALYHRESPLTDLTNLLHLRVDLAPGDLTRLVFHAAAGVYFGMIFLMRGFGVVVAVHAMYDAAVLLS